MAVNLQKFFALKPNGLNISEPKNLREFINKYPNEQLRPNMRKLLEDYHNFRPIKGDGNCFYRACAFLYFCNSDLKVPIFDCRQLPFIREQNINAAQILEYIWRVYFKPIAKEPTDARIEKIEDIFNCSFQLDLFIIAYFRSLNHKYLKSQQSKFKAYTENMDRELNKVLTLHEESEGVEIFSLAQRLNAKITIMMTHEKTLKQVKYNEGGKYSFILFYRPGHYDILMPVTIKLGPLFTPVEQISQMYSYLPYQPPPPRIKKTEKNETREDFMSNLAPIHNSYQQRSCLSKFNQYHEKRQKDIESRRILKFEMSSDTPKKRLEESKRDTPHSRSRYSDRSTEKKQEEEIEEKYERPPRQPVKIKRGPSISQLAVYKDAAIFIGVILIVIVAVVFRR